MSKNTWDKHSRRTSFGTDYDAPLYDELNGDKEFEVDMENSGEIPWATNSLGDPMDDDGDIARPSYKRSSPPPRVNNTPVVEQDSKFSPMDYFADILDRPKWQVLLMGGAVIAVIGMVWTYGKRTKWI